MISDGQWDSVFGLGFGRLQGSFSADVVDTFQSIGDVRQKNCAFRRLWPRNRCRHCKVDEAGEIKSKELNFLREVDGMRNEANSCAKNCAFRRLWPRNRCRHCKVDEAGEIKSKELNFLLEVDGMRNEANSCANRWVCSERW